jgi:sugar lactone lactonase YvrE
MINATLTTVLDGYGFFEAPHWHEGQLWLVDHYTHAVYAVADDGAVETMIDLPGQPNGLSWLPDGKPLIAMKHGSAILRQEPDGTLVTHADISGLTPWIITDVIADTDGRAYVSHTGFDLDAGAEVQSSTIIRVDLDGNLTEVASDLYLPNNMSWRDGGRTLISSETIGQRLTAFDVDDDGDLTNKRSWAEFGDPLSMGDLVAGDAVLMPDGHTNDAEGAIWVADAAARGQAVRVGSGGEVLDKVQVDGIGIYACELGGEDGHTLYLCAAPEWDEKIARENHQAKLLACRVDVPRAS